MTYRKHSTPLADVNAEPRQPLEPLTMPDTGAVIEAHQLAVDHEGRVLVWISTVGTAPEAALPSPQATLQSLPQANHPLPHVISAPTHCSAAEAERRQLTGLFCDLVDSPALAGQLDPADLRGVVRVYQAICAEVSQRFDGHIAQYLGDGLRIYCGYPQAHEDNAQRAVRTGLAILAAIQQLNACLAQEQRVRLAVRLGIHTSMRLARLWQQQGKRAEAQQLLGEV